MTERVWMLELERSGWRLCASGESGLRVVAEEAIPDGQVVGCAEAICRALAADSHQGESILLALGSEWCLAATLAVDQPAQLRDRKTMHYRLEEVLPWSAEECVGDYVAAGNRAMTVAVPIAPLADLIQSLERNGLSVQSIVPAALLAAAEHLTGDWPARHVALFGADGVVDLVRFSGGKPVAWSSFAHADGVQQELVHLALEEDAATQVVSYGLDEPARGALKGDWTIQGAGASLPSTAARSELALAAASKILLGQVDPLLELKRGAFGRSGRRTALRRHWQALEVAAVVLILAVAGGLFYRGHAAGRQAQLLASEQVAVFRSVFPNARVPVGIRGRLESELAKLQGLQGGDETLPGTAAATTVLSRLLASLPTDRRFRLLEIRIEKGALYLDGEVRAHGDAEILAQRLRANSFEVPSPRSQRLDEGRVSLRITGKFALARTTAKDKRR